MAIIILNGKRHENVNFYKNKLIGDTIELDLNDYINFETTALGENIIALVRGVLDYDLLYMVEDFKNLVDEGLLVYMTENSESQSLTVSCAYKEKSLSNDLVKTYHSLTTSKYLKPTSRIRSLMLVDNTTDLYKITNKDSVIKTFKNYSLVESENFISSKPALEYFIRFRDEIPRGYIL